MKIISNKKYDLKALGIESECEVHCIHVQIIDIKGRADEMITAISDESWISKLSGIRNKTFKARAQRTIEKLVNDILKKVDDNITAEFGEFLISDTAQLSLELEHLHTKVPLAELLKEKVSGNPGFDFHTESDRNHIMFGEAKYSGGITPRAKAINQITDFITLEKDNAELIILENFVSEEAIKNAEEEKKGYVAAFSLNSDNPDLIFINALNSDAIKSLFAYPELYLIAIQV
jgi:hypothetical protein|tara:strand:- start:3207 stop:3905 length:699 start_codon:yes stop_codon:yes gene_type:complete